METQQDSNQFINPNQPSTSSWYNSQYTNGISQFGTSISPIATTIPQAYTPGVHIQPSEESTGLTPFVNFAESPLIGQTTNASPPQVDSLFSGIDFSEVSHDIQLDRADKPSLCCNRGRLIV